MNIKKDWKVFKNADWGLADVMISWRQKKITLNYHIIVEGIIMGEEEKIIRADGLKPEIILDNYQTLEDSHITETEAAILSEVDSEYNEYVKDKVLSEKEKSDKREEISNSAYKRAKILYYQQTKEVMFKNIADEFGATQAIKDLNKQVYKELRG